MNTPSSSVPLNIVATALLTGCLHNGKQGTSYSSPIHTQADPGYTIQAPSTPLSTKEATDLTEKVERGGASADQSTLNACSTHFNELLTAKAQALCGSAMWDAYTGYEYTSGSPRHPLQLPEVVAVSPNVLDHSEAVIPHINAETAGGKPLDLAVADLAVIANELHPSSLSPDAQKAMEDACVQVLLEPGAVWTEPTTSEYDTDCSYSNGAADWHATFLEDKKKLCFAPTHYSCFSLYLSSLDSETGHSSLALPDLQDWNEGVNPSKSLGK